MLTLLIARHGNTFDAGDTVLRVGKRTNLPLSNSGKEQAKKLGVFLKEKYPKIDRVFVSSLKRTQETASIALPNNRFEINPMFDEIDYGIDDGKPETEVIARLGAEALKNWEENSIAPKDWHVDAEKIKQDWRDFAKNLITSVGAIPCGCPSSTSMTILVVTSNGIARFAPSILSKVSFQHLTPLLKMRTGALSAFEYNEENWKIDFWDKRPE